MGVLLVNVELTAHAQPPGSESQWIKFHHGNLGLDETHSLDLATWSSMRDDVVANDRSAFEAALTSCVVPTGGWTQERKDAAWRAAQRNWQR